MGFVLIVDDEEEIGLELLDSVEALGHNGRFFLSPVFGLQFLRETELKVDFAFVDLMMPEIDGETFIKHAKKETGLTTRFYLMSGVPKRDMLVSTSLDELRFLQKPISLTQIKTCLA